jgi:SAM-dependent methyltransferase
MPDPHTPCPAADQYDSFADIYEVWTDTAASTRSNLEFYVNLYTEEQGPVVELGVGDGRIAVPAAIQGRSVIGVDLSPAMLERCRLRATAAGVSDRVTLLLDDFRSFQIDEPASLIALPYHSLGHLLSLDDKRRAMANVFSQLEPGGRFVFDDFRMTPTLIDHMRRVQLRAEYRSAAGTNTLLWVTSLVDEVSQSMTVVTWEDALTADGVLERRRYRRLSLTWLEPPQARRLLEESGFIVEACYGDFDRTPFVDATASEQVWIARRPA